MIVFASRVLTAPDNNYSVTYLETLTIVWTLKLLQNIVMGYNVVVYKDHAAITDPFKKKNSTAIGLDGSGRSKHTIQN